VLVGLGVTEGLEEEDCEDNEERELEGEGLTMEVGV
jgi:hypothetical protein